jgi:diketogulonate reductase-like aldo/keto reductase
MERRAFGWMSTLVPVIGQGTWAMEANRRESIAALRRGMDLGMTHIDTAEMYGSGAVEEIVGEALAGRRHEAFVVSKVLPENASRQGTIAACERSLRRLRMDYLDAYLLHWPSQHPLADTIAAFEALVRSGKIKAWGVSNFSADLLEEAVRLAGPNRVACNQVPYYLENRAEERHVAPTCARHHITFVGYSPFGQGTFRTHTVLEDIARAHGATARQVALRFLVRDPNAFTIPKASTVEHVEENAGAGSLHVTEEEIRRIDAAFPRNRPGRKLRTGGRMLAQLIVFPLHVVSGGDAQIRDLQIFQYLAQLVRRLKHHVGW